MTVYRGYPVWRQGRTVMVLELLDESGSVLSFMVFAREER